MLKERFLFVTESLANGTMTVTYCDSMGQVEVQLPKVMWMQLTAEDLIRGSEGNLNKVFHRDVQTVIVHESKWDVIIRLNP